MANFLTQGRKALWEALQEDDQIAARVKTWFEFGAGLQRRYSVEPARCPLLSLAPAEGESVRTANALTDVAQRLRIEVATDGQDAEPIEELVALILDRIRQSSRTCLGLAGEGLAALEVEGVTWRALPDASGARLLWTARIVVSLLWKRA